MDVIRQKFPQFDEAGQALIGKAYKIAEAALSGKTRENGRPFLDHPMKTALIATDEIGLPAESAPFFAVVKDGLRLLLGESQPAKFLQRDGIRIETETLHLPARRLFIHRPGRPTMAALSSNDHRVSFGTGGCTLTGPTPPSA